MLKKNEQKILKRIQMEIFKWQTSDIHRLAKLCVMSKKIEKEETMAYFESTENVPVSMPEMHGTSNLHM